MIPRYHSIDGKIQGEFYPLQKHELTALKEDSIINNTTLVHLALRIENPFNDKNIRIKPKEFGLRWGIPESSVYKAIGRLQELGAIEIESGEVVVSFLEDYKEKLPCEDDEPLTGIALELKEAHDAKEAQETSKIRGKGFGEVKKAKEAKEVKEIKEVKETKETKETQCVKRDADVQLSDEEMKIFEHLRSIRNDWRKQPWRSGRCAESFTPEVISALYNSNPDYYEKKGGDISGVQCVVMNYLKKLDKDTKSDNPDLAISAYQKLLALISPTPLKREDVPIYFSASDHPREEIADLNDPKIKALIQSKKEQLRAQGIKI